MELTTQELISIAKEPDLNAFLRHEAEMELKRRIQLSVPTVNACSGGCGADCDNTCGESKPVYASEMNEGQENAWIAVWSLCSELGLTLRAGGENAMKQVLAFIRTLHAENQAGREQYQATLADGEQLKTSLRLADERIAELQELLASMTSIAMKMDALYGTDSFQKTYEMALRHEQDAEGAWKQARADGYKGDSLSEWAQMILQANKMEKQRGDRYEEAWEHLRNIVTGNRKLSPTGTEMCAERHKRVFDALYALDRAAPVNSRWCIQDGDLCCHALGRNVPRSFDTPADALVNFMDTLPKTEESQSATYAQTFEQMRKDSPE